MNSPPVFLLVTVGIGGGLFVFLILFWFVKVYIKRRVAPETDSHAGGLRRTLTGWEEKRAQPRLAVSWQAAIESPLGTLTAQIKDISLGGAFAVCPEPLALQQRFKIRMEPPNQPALELNAEVVWSNVNVPPERVIYRGMGIRFIDNPEVERRKLSEAISAILQEAAA